MLRVVDTRHGRREFLRIGGLGLGGLTLPGLMAAREALGKEKNLVRDRSVVFLFMHGGPAQTETFDPKMDAPAGIRSATGEVATSIPGVTFGSTYPLLAKLAHKLAVVRSYQPGDANHDIKPIVSKYGLGANLGSLYTRIAGSNHPQTGMPRNAAIFPRAVKEAAQPPLLNFGNFFATGDMSKAYAPFVLGGGGGQLQDNLKLSIPAERLADRRNLLAGLDRIKRNIDATGDLSGMDRMQVQALDTIVGGVSDAFDLSKEDPRTLARYDTEPLMTPDDISRKWNNHKWYVDNAQTLGKLMLLARRLCEAGCGFVTVTTGFVWDMHSDANNAPVGEGMGYAGPPFDRAVSAFIEDVEARGLSDKILLVCCGEMGRTPSIDAKGGRNHWGNLGPLLLYGGGLNMGQVIGQSTRNVGDPLTEPQRIPNLIATIMHTLLDAGELRLQPGVSTELMRTLFGAPPIPGLL